MNGLSDLFRRILYEVFYLRGRPPWDSGITPPEVVQVIEVEHFTPGRALDIGCGTGTNVLYLAQHGFEATGVDFVPRAIAEARAKSRKANVRVDFRVANVLQPLELGKPFDFVLDIGCFHNFDEAGRRRYADNLSRWTHPGALYMLYALFPLTRWGRRFGVSPQEVVEAFGSQFKLVNQTVSKSNFGTDSAWYRWERK